MGVIWSCWSWCCLVGFGRDRLAIMRTANDRTGGAVLSWCCWLGHRNVNKHPTRIIGSYREICRGIKDKALWMKMPRSQSLIACIYEDAIIARYLRILFIRHYWCVRADAWERYAASFILPIHIQPRRSFYPSFLANAPFIISCNFWQRSLKLKSVIHQQKSIKLKYVHVPPLYAIACGAGEFVAHSSHNGVLPLLFFILNFLNKNHRMKRK